MRTALLAVLSALFFASTAAFVCRSWPYGTVPDAVVRNDECDCCDCSDEPGTGMTRDSCVVDESVVAAARMMKERTHRKTRKTKIPDVSSLVKDAATKHREQARAAEEAKKVAEAQEAIVHSRLRRERVREFNTKLDSVAEGSSVGELKRMIADLATSFNESSAEWVADAIARAGVSHVDRTDAVVLGANVNTVSQVLNRDFDDTTRAEAMCNALGVGDLDRDALVRAWKAALMHENGTIMIEAAGLQHLPPHWNATAFPTLDVADKARARYTDAKKDEDDATKVEREFEGRKTLFNFGPNRSFTTFDGKCFDVSRPVKGELGYRHERPSEICFYRFARYGKFTSQIVDLRTSGVPVPSMLFVNKDAVKACAKEEGHKTVVSFVCFTEDMFLFSEAISRCAINVTYGTPLGC
eukprot:CAMPEP_0174835686 /NCGR_PEP_ID=MMETSP1114-20130205/5534_1 /TAXON_ID=312471 /ORGANISM="Neobodo designis, Strain CCAP 1951/1" /LENGTH=411 /DNA_ID=CAMNT_0016069639 /DNA_START=32 /DNA_END=1267 /DNA_ORIENTATION=+